MKPKRAQEWMNQLDNMPAHQLHPAVKMLLRELMDEVTDGDLPAADEHLQPARQ